ncbi:MAG: hypothetical protein V8S24_01455 [Gordonibacter pamelaeae]
MRSARPHPPAPRPPAAARPHRRRPDRAPAPSRARQAVAAACLAAGLALMLYPVVGTLLNERSFTDAVGRYEEQAAALPEKERQEMLAAAHAYNDSLRGDPVHDPFIPNSGWAQPEGYDDVLDVDGAGLMGVVEVPAIGVRLPIRHGTSDEVLAHGAGHIPDVAAGRRAGHARRDHGPHGAAHGAAVRRPLAAGGGDVFVVEVLGRGTPTPWTTCAWWSPTRWTPSASTGTATSSRS